MLLHSNKALNFDFFKQNAEYTTLIHSEVYKLWYGEPE